MATTKTNSPVQVYEGAGNNPDGPEQIVVEAWQLGDEYVRTGAAVQVFKEDYDNLPLNPDQRICTTYEDLVNEPRQDIAAWNGQHLNLISAVRLPDGAIGYDVIQKVLQVVEQLRPGPRRD